MASKDQKKKGLTDDQKEEIKQAFQLFDTDDSGSIDGKELTTVLRALGFEPEPGEVEKMISDVDDDGNGTMEFDDFMRMMEAKIKNQDPDAGMHKAYKLFDDDETG